jgi:cytochrome c553
MKAGVARYWLMAAFASVLANPVGNDASAQSPASPTPARQKPASGSGVTGTNATGDTSTSDAAAHRSNSVTQPDAVPALSPSPVFSPGDAHAGAQVANGGAPDKGVVACSSCHGADGAGNPTTGFPRIAGFPEQYLSKQLDDYATGRRNHPIMSQFAKGLDDAQRRNVAAFYSSLAPAPPSPTAGRPSRGTARARQLAMYGDENLHAQACNNCHGPDGSGEAPTYPQLAGQHAMYLRAALGAWRDGSRNNDPSGQMQTIAKSLHDSDIEALAALFEAASAQSGRREAAADPRSDDRAIIPTRRR